MNVKPEDSGSDAIRPPAWITLALCSAATVGGFFLWRKVDGVLEENHVIESTQAVLLALATALHWLRMRAATVPAALSFHATLAILMVSLFLREVDIDDFGESLFWEWIELIARLGAGIFWIFLGVHLIRRRNVLEREPRGLAFNPCSRFVWLGIALYATSWFFDKEIYPLTLTTSMFFEETLQLNATLLFFLGALLARGMERPRFRN